jgi:hypothetical protein
MSASAMTKQHLKLVAKPAPDLPIKRQETALETDLELPRKAILPPEAWRVAIDAVEPLVVLSELRNSPQRPMLYRLRTREQILEDFIRTEWLERGWNPQHITRKIVALYDPPLANAVNTYEHRTALLPAHLRFAKAIARTNAQERKLTAM